MKYYIVYQINNKINNMIYIGCHVTNNPKDKYMGSGTNIRKAIKQYGLENFDKSILYCFDNEQEMLDKEAELVNREFIAQDTNYNIIIGGRQFLTLDTVTVKDKNNNYYQVHKTDPRYLSGELVAITTNKAVVKDENQNIFQIDINNTQYLSGELKSIMIDKVIVKDKYNKTFQVDITDSKYLSGELVGCTKNMLSVKDKFGNVFFVNKNDSRYLSGELNFHWQDKKHTQETKNKMSEKAKLHIGELNSSFGTCWILKGVENKKIKKEELEKYLSLGWIKGRKINK